MESRAVRLFFQLLLESIFSVMKRRLSRIRHGFCDITGWIVDRRADDSSK